MDYREEGKKILGQFTEHDLDVFEKGARHGDATHDENHRMPEEWYERRECRRNEVSPKVSAFYEAVKNRIKEGQRLSQEEFRDYVETHTLEVLISQLTDSSNEEAGILLECLIEAREKDSLIREKKSTY